MKDILPGPGGSSPTNLTQFNGTLFFCAFGRDGGGLWRSDGTANGTVQVKAFIPGTLFDFRTALIVFNGPAFAGNPNPSVPELDAGMWLTSLTLLTGGILIATNRVRRR